jgi:hypothetical protein
MEISNAKYYEENGEKVCVTCALNGKNTAIPINPNNRHYAEILEQVKEGTLKIAEAD